MATKEASQIAQLTEAKRISTRAKTGAGFTMEAVRNMAVNNLDRRIYMADKQTSETYNAAAAELEAAAKRLDTALNGLLAAEKATSEKAKAAVARAKDSAAQIGDALSRVNKVLGSDFASQLVQLERTAAAFERLAELNEAGKLASLMSALKA